MDTVCTRTRLVERPRLRGVRSARILEPHWICGCIHIHIRPLHQPHRVRAHPPPQPRRVIPRPVIIQPALTIALHARKAVAFACETTETRLTVRCVLLTVDPAAAV